MFDSHLSSRGARDPFAALHGAPAPTRIFLSRRHFEQGIVHLLEAERADCAVLHVAVEGNAGTGSVCRRMLNLVGNTLRTCMRGGAAAYLGDAEFAVLLQGTDAQAAETYARTVISIISGFRVSWNGELLGAYAYVGGVLAGDCQDGRALLNQAMGAGKTARLKPLSRLHLLRSMDEETAFDPLAAIRGFSLKGNSTASEAG